MRRMTYFVMALALVLGFTQCKKEQPTPQTQGVRITLNVDSGNDGSRVVVDPTHNGANDYASVTFDNGDKIYVGYQNAYVGCLTYNGTNFSGSVDIDEANYGDPLHFYFLGGLDFQPDPSDISGNSVSVTISDQSSKYPVISYSPSNEDFAGEGSYSAVLKNKVSIMKFNVTTPSEAAICITGMNNKVTVDFTSPTGTDNGFTYDQVDDGLIKMAGQAGSGEKTYWAIVLPQSAVAPGDAYSMASDHDYVGTHPAVAAGIGSNQYLNSGIDLTLSQFGLDVTKNSSHVSFSSYSNGTANYSLAGYNYYVTGTGNANFTTNTTGSMYFDYPVNITGCLDFGQVNHIRFAQSNQSYSINNSGATAINGSLNIGNDEAEGSKPVLYIDGNIVYGGNTNSGIRHTEVHVNGNITKNGTWQEFFISEGADVYVEGNITGTFNLTAGAYLRVKGSVISATVVDDNDNAVAYTTDDDGYKVYHYEASSLIEINVSGTLFYFEAGETWEEAIQNHSENSGWWYDEDGVYWTDGGDLNLVLYFYDTDSKVYPFDEVQDSDWYLLVESGGGGGGLQSFEIGGIATIFYVEGETWAQAIDRHSSENADWSYFEDPEDPEVYYVSYYYDYNDQYWWVNSDNGLISPNDEIDPNSNYSLY